MKMIVIMADASRLDAVREALADLGASGYTIFPILEGGGRSGIHAGDRIHPGALAAVVVIEADDRAGPLFDALVARRDAAEDRISRLFLVPVERQA